MKLKFLSFLVFISLKLLSQYSEPKYTEKTYEDFFPKWEELKYERIDWGTIKVLESWNTKSEKKIELAFAVIKGKEQKNNPTIFLQGGPGGSSINGISRWLNHPLRDNGDVILVDLRGTGFSKPNLCPDLGNDILNILAKNQDVNKDENEKMEAALSCRDHLLEEGIDINSYNSTSIAKDLHALKNALKIDVWNLYGVSYGTYTSQVYVNLFSEDIDNVILDSPISSIEDYFDLNTSNYLSSLNFLFQECQNNPECNTYYPNLEDVYYETIQKLAEEPITVEVENGIIPTGKFTYNVEDFKIAIQQSLYQKKLVEILPALIYEFNQGNEDALSNLVAAFSGALGLDYGTYYCTTCYEAINKNSLIEYQEDSKKEKRLRGGLSFYKSDYDVCNKWNLKSNSTLDSINFNNGIEKPLLLFSGGFDPITPVRNAEFIDESLKNSIHINFPYQGHGTSFSNTGKKILNDFISKNTIDPKDYNLNEPITFVTNINLKGGIAKFAGSLGKFDLIELIPIIIALLTIVMTVINFLSHILRVKRKKKGFILIYTLASLLSLGFISTLIYAIQNTAKDNFYILALGLPEKYSFLFYFPYVSLSLFLIITLFYVIYYKNIKEKTLLFAGLFSFFIYHLYLFNWQLIF